MTLVGIRDDGDDRPPSSAPSLGTFALAFEGERAGA